MIRKNLISLTVLFTFFLVSATGIVLFYRKDLGLAKAIHVGSGFLFITAGILHLINNWVSIKLYSKDKQSGRLRKEFYLSAVLSSIFSFIVYFIGLPIWLLILRFVTRKKTRPEKS
jgi:lysylphosphatidylglycerol synthetase-like protein (DUF2156 family)